MAILALDYGQRYCGIAISDPSDKIAFPLYQLDQKKENLILYLKKIIDERQVRLLLIGLPVRLSGEECAITQKVKAFKKELEQELTIDIIYQDERFTSVQAQKNLIALSLYKNSKTRLDESAAALMLQTYLDKKTAN